METDLNDLLKIPEANIYFEYIKLWDETRNKIREEMNNCMKEISASILDNTTYIVINGLMLRIYSFLRYFIINSSNLHPQYGQIIYRAQLESYFYLKYILIDDTKTSSLAQAFREYGVWQEKKIKLQYQKYVETSVIPTNAAFDDFINSSSIWEKRDELVDVDFKMFENLRTLCDYIWEKTLYDIDYSIGSQYSHGSYNIIKYNHLKICENPLHNFHFTPRMWDDFFDGEEMDFSILIKCIDIFNKSYNVWCTYYKIKNNITIILDEYWTKFEKLMNS